MCFCSRPPSVPPWVVFSLSITVATAGCPAPQEVFPNVPSECKYLSLHLHVFLNLHLLDGRHLQGYDMCFVYYTLISGGSLKNIEPSRQDHRSSTGPFEFPML